VGNAHQESIAKKLKILNVGSMDINEIKAKIQEEQYVYTSPKFINPKTRGRDDARG
jgi:uncharacterized protein YfkK (UPF0435 family)